MKEIDVAHEPFIPFKKPLEMTLPEPNEPPLAFICISRAWLPVVLGALTTLQDRATWGTDEALAKENMSKAGDLILRFFTQECTNLMEFRQTGCVLEALIDGVWTPLIDVSTCGAQGEQGPQGVPGATGGTGATGPQGEPGTPGQTAPDPDVPPGGAVPITNRTQQLCAMAQGFTAWLVDKVSSGVMTMKAAAQAGKAVVDWAGAVVDAIPIFGALIRKVVDGAYQLAVKGDFDDVYAQLIDPAFYEWAYCIVYCYLRNHVDTEFKLEHAIGAWEELNNKAFALPPGGPLITFYGQPFALISGGLSQQAIMQHFVLYADETSNDCELACLDCARDTFCRMFDKDGGLETWEPWEGFASWTGSEWVSVPTDYGHRLALTKKFPARMVRHVNFCTWRLSNSGFPDYNYYALKDGGQVDAGWNDAMQGWWIFPVGTDVEMDEIRFSIDCFVGTAKITAIQIYGDGKSPFGYDNCVDTAQENWPDCPPV